MLNPELNADITIRQLERERDHYIAHSRALRALAERPARPAKKRLSPWSVLGHVWRAIAIPRRQPTPRRAEAAA